MKNFIVFFFSALLICVGAFYLYLTFGASAFGPKSEVSEACNAITKGMKPEEIVEISDRYEGMDIYADSLNSNQVQMSKVEGGWICVCHANLQADADAADALMTVTSVDKVFCSD